MKNVVDENKTDLLSDYAAGLSGGLSESFTVDKILEATLNGESIFNTGEIIESIKELFFFEMRAAMVMGIEILGICIAVGLLKNLSDSLGKKGVSDMATLILSAIIIGLAMTNFHTVYQLTIDAVSTITYTMEILLPVLIGILIGMGKVASGTIMSPLLLTAVTVFQAMIKNIIMPAIFLSAVIGLINCLTEKDYVNQLSKFIRQAALFVTGILITLMSGIIAIQGLIASAGDSLLLGTAKYSIDTFIPIVGGFTSDTIELFLKCMGSIKGVVGVFGILIICCLIFIPLIKILAVTAVYKITALLIEPVATKKISAGIADMGTSLVAMGAVLFFGSLLFIIFITSMITVGGS